MAGRRRPPEEDEGPPPWLETREVARRSPPPPAEPDHTFISWRTLLVGALVAVALAVALVIGVRALVGDNTEGTSAGVEGDLIRAPDEPYKTRPADAGGAELAGVDDALFEAGEGADPIGEIAADAMPEEPLRPGPAPTDLLARTDPEAEPQPGPEAQDLSEMPPAPLPAPAPLPPPAPRKAEAARPAPPTAEPRREAAATPTPKPVPKPAPAPARPPGNGPGSGSGGALQLGAFATRASAEDAWKRFSARFAYLQGLEHRVEPVERDGTTLYRLRAVGTGASAEELCGRLRIAGESCMVVD